MKRVLLVCNAGMSTSILVKKMLDEVEKRNIECKIEAHSSVGLSGLAGEWDVCLVGPQIRFQKDKIKATLNDIPTEVIDMKIYGMADGSAALDQALGLFE